MSVFELRQIGRVQSSLTVRAAAPRQPNEGAPEAWLHAADRSTLTVHPRGDFDRLEQGVFTSRAPDRPNPIGLHRVRVVEVAGLRLRVDALEALDGTPILDLKPVIGDIADR
jgi:tRNA-Thr(GGU) m(6)t(6)A37 methyltransferase TsaA